MIVFIITKDYYNMLNRTKFILFALVTLFLIFLNINLGASYIPLKKIILFFTNKLSTVDTDYLIISQIRIPRIIAAISSGICLSLSGLFMQTYFKNPLAGPYVLGISSGASLFVAFYILAFSFLNNVLPSWFSNLGFSFFAISGSIFFMFLIYLISLRLKQLLTILIAGILLGSIANALITLLQYIAGAEELKAYILWNMGSIYQTSTTTSIIIIIIALFLMLLSFKKAFWFDIWLLGEDQAKTMGISIRLFNILIFLFTAILTGLSTAFYGPIAFIGLLSPHIARMTFKTALHKILIPATAITGIFLVILTDTFIQLLVGLTSSTLIPFNTMASLLSIPLLGYLLYQKKELWM